MFLTFMLAALLQAMPMTGGGDVSMLADGDVLRVTVTGPRAGLASLCVGDDSRVRILHASAAIGEAVYERSGDRWALKSNFEWKMRDSRTSPPTDADKQRLLSELGWSANPSNAGEPVREFTIRQNDRIRFIGVTYLSIKEPMAISYWPRSMDDGCREMKVLQGYLPSSVSFRPATWHRLR